VIFQLLFLNNKNFLWHLKSFFCFVSVGDALTIGMSLSLKSLDPEPDRHSEAGFGSRGQIERGSMWIRIHNIVGNVRLTRSFSNGHMSPKRRGGGGFHLSSCCGTRLGGLVAPIAAVRAGGTLPWSATNETHRGEASSVAACLMVRMPFRSRAAGTTADPAGSVRAQLCFLVLG
jgi:hypothetical protein